MSGSRGAIRSFFYRLLWFLSRSALKASSGCLYLAAGLLREDQLQAASHARWREFGTAVDDADAGLSEAEGAFYTRFLRGPDRVLLVGSGAGRDLLALHSMGYDVTGLEQVPELVELSRQRVAARGLTIPIQAATIQAADLDGQFDTVIFSLGCYSYVHRSAVRVSALARINQHLRPGGRVVLTYHPAQGGSPMARWLTQVSARLSGAGWQPEPGDRFSRDYAISGGLRYQHEFEPQELARECAAAGFQIVADEPDGSMRFAAAIRRDGPPGPATSARMALQTAGSEANDRR